MALIETITARLTADVGQFQQGFAQANQTVGNFQTTATKSTATARGLQNALRAVAFQATGVPGPVGRLATVLSSFAIGGGLVTGILAGLAAIGLAMKVLGDKANLLANNVVAARERLRRVIGEVGEGVESEEDLGLLRRRLKEAQDELATMRRQTTTQMTRFGPMQVPSASFAELTAKQNVINQLTAAIAQAEKNLAPIRAKAAQELDQVLETVEDFVQELPIMQLQIEGVTADFLEWFAASEQLRASLEALRRSGIEAFESEAAGRIFQMTGGRPDLSILGIPSPEEVEQMLDAINMEFGIGELSDNLNKQFAQMGLDAMQSLARSLLSGAKNIKELLFGLLLDFSLGGIFAGIGNALGLNSVSSLQAAPTANLSAQPMQLQVGTGTLPPPMTPFEASRDAMWQRMLRESVLVAKSQGFR